MLKIGSNRNNEYDNIFTLNKLPELLAYITAPDELKIWNVNGKDNTVTFTPNSPTFVETKQGGPYQKDYFIALKRIFTAHLSFVTITTQTGDVMTRELIFEQLDGYLN